MRGLFNALGIISATGCCSAAPAATPPESANAAGTDYQRLIIKFKTTTFKCDADGIAKLSTATGVTVEFVHPMSGDACVIQQYANSSDGLLQGQEVLRQHPAVEWLEQDRKMKALMHE